MVCVNMEDEIVYSLITVRPKGEIVNIAISDSRDEIRLYRDSRKMVDTKILAINKSMLDDESLSKLNRFIQTTQLLIQDEVDGIPITDEDWNMINEAECCFHDTVNLAIKRVEYYLETNFIRFSKDEKRMIEKMLCVLRGHYQSVYGMSEDDDDYYEPLDPYDIIDYKKLMEISCII